MRVVDVGMRDSSMVIGLVIIWLGSRIVDSEFPEPMAVTSYL